jgi:hypothetical protein
MSTLGQPNEPGELRSNVFSSPPSASTGLNAYSYEQDWNLVQQPLGGQVGPLPLEAPDDGSSSFHGFPQVEIPTLTAFLGGNIDFIPGFLVPSASGE